MIKNMRVSSFRRIPVGLRSPYRLSRRHIHPDNGFFRVAEEVREAIHAKKPVVALETTIYTHGFPYPDNVALASHLESVVRVNGGVPATIGIIDGIAKVGMDPDEIIKLASSVGNPETLKISRRDLGYACGLKLAGKKFNGGTTIAGTMILAHLAGIQVFGTGGLGGVHRGAESSMDISADLTELGRTPVAVISSGCKSFLDIPRTLEYLETEGVGVATFADGREGKVDFPAFWSRDSGSKSPVTIQNEIEAASIIHAQSMLNIQSGLLFANPISEKFSIPKPKMDAIIEEAIRLADAQGATGKDNTPFILNKIKELSRGESIPANRELIASNVRRATIVAVELARLKQEELGGQIGKTAHKHDDLASKRPVTIPVPDVSKLRNPNPVGEGKKPAETAQVVVAGALAVDLSCNYTPILGSAASISPQLHTSNPCTITQTLGGVAHNIAKALHYAGVTVKLCTAVGDDLSGRAAVDLLSSQGLQAGGIQTLPSTSGRRTAQYVAVNDAQRNLMVAMADMSILENIPSDFSTLWGPQLASSLPSWLVADANWDVPTLSNWLTTATSLGIKTAFEPVSAAKSTRLFASNPLPTYPNNLLTLITPNSLELASMHAFARERGLFDSQEWWSVIDSLGIPSTGARAPLAHMTTSALVDQGIPQQAIQLLPFVPCVLTKLGAGGVLLVQLLPAEDPRLYDRESSPYILSRSQSGSGSVGGVYVRLFGPAEVVGQEEIVSVNGVGDTFLGVLIAGLITREGSRVEDVVGLAQRAAVMTLRSKEAVSPLIKNLQSEIWRR